MSDREIMVIDREEKSHYKPKGYNVGWFQASFFFDFCRLFILFCFVVAICDILHDVETIFHLSYVLTASGNIF